jgi:hypothetical protein
MVNCKQDAFDGTLVKGSGRKQFNNEPNNLSTERHNEISQRELQTRPSEIRRACENLCRNTLCVRESLQLKNSESRKNPGRIPEKHTNLAEQSRKTIGSVGRIPEESRKNPGKTNKTAEQSRKNPGRLPEKQTRPSEIHRACENLCRNTPCVRESLQLKNSESQKNPGRIPEEPRKNKQT